MSIDCCISGAATIWICVASLMEKLEQNVKLFSTNISFVYRLVYLEMQFSLNKLHNK